MSRASKFTREELGKDPEGVDVVVSGGTAVLLPRASRRLASEDRAVLLEVALLGRQLEALEQREDALIRAARPNVSWGQLASALGMSEQGLRRKYADVVAAERADRLG